MNGIKGWPATTKDMEKAGYVFRMSDIPCERCHDLISWVFRPDGRVVPFEKVPRRAWDDDQDRWREHLNHCPLADVPRRPRRPKDTSQLRGLGEEYVQKDQ